MSRRIRERRAIFELHYQGDIGHLSFSQDAEGNLLVKDCLNQSVTTLHSRLYMPHEMQCYDAEKYHMMRSIIKLYSNFKSSSNLSGVIFLFFILSFAGIFYQSGFADVPLWILLAIASSFSFSLASRMAMSECDSVVKALYHYILYVNCIGSEPFDFI